jgi:single-strand DNA-binding protein
MTDSITVTGVVGSDPRLHVTTQGLAITSFRLASTRRYFDRVKSTWEDGEPFSETARSQFAVQVSQSRNDQERVSR